MSQSKSCTTCGENFPATNEYFHKNKKGKYGLDAKCKKCRRQYNKNRRLENKIYWNSHNPFDLDENKTCSECKKEYPKTREFWYKKSSEKDGLRRNCKSCCLKHKFGITLKQYNKLFEEQEGKCAICKIHQTELNTALAIDHNHKNGKVRGLLCISCNTALGFIEDKDFLKKSKMYLEKYEDD